MVSTIRDQHIARRNDARKAAGGNELSFETATFPVARYGGEEPEKPQLRLARQQVRKRKRTIIPFPGTAALRDRHSDGRSQRQQTTSRRLSNLRALPRRNDIAVHRVFASAAERVAAALYRPQDLSLLIAGCIFLVLATAILSAGSPLWDFALNSTLTELSAPDQSRSSDALYHYVDPEGEYDVIGSSVSVAPEQFSKMTVTEYTIKPGDTLLGLALEFDLNMGTIISFNQIEDVRRIRVGESFRIPDRDGILYTVRRGDSLSEISARYNVSVDRILDANNLRSSTIRVNQTLFVPGAKMDPVEVDLILGRLFRYPMQGRLSSRSGMRNDPFTGVRRFHNGIDMTGTPGTRVAAAMSGTVAHVGNQLGNYGRFVIMKHERGFQTLYAHLARVDVRAGMYVSQGEAVGIMGNSGRSTGRHLHFSVIKNGTFVDPLEYLR